MDIREEPWNVVGLTAQHQCYEEVCTDLLHLRPASVHQRRSCVHECLGLSFSTIVRYPTLASQIMKDGVFFGSQSDSLPTFIESDNRQILTSTDTVRFTECCFARVSQCTEFIFSPFLSVFPSQSLQLVEPIGPKSPQQSYAPYPASITSSTLITGKFTASSPANATYPFPLTNVHNAGTFPSPVVSASSRNISACAGPEI